ncbi:MAG: recombinase family protein, partial [Rhodomicrobium sp.]
YLNLSRAAKLLVIAPKTLRLAAEAGEIDAIHPLPDGLWIFSREVLASSKAQMIVTRAARAEKHPTGHHPDQQNLFSSTT